jgi:hypothetical protein
MFEKLIINFLIYNLEDKICLLKNFDEEKPPIQVIKPIKQIAAFLPTLKR